MRLLIRKKCKLSEDPKFGASEVDKGADGDGDKLGEFGDEVEHGSKQPNRSRIDSQREGIESKEA
jgi:hypothetical protein